MKSPYFFANIKAAFFDLDETLTDADTDVLWSKWRLSQSPRAVIEILWLLKLHWQYIHGRFNIHTYMRYQSFRMKVYTPARFREMADRFFAQKGKKHIHQGTASLVEEYHRLDIPVVLITNQHQVIARPFAEHLRISHVIANRNEEKSNAFGATITPYSFGEGKVHYARQWCSRMGFTLSEVAFYSDSHHDMPLLLESACPVAVNPDTHLEREASERGWPVMIGNTKKQK